MEIYEKIRLLRESQGLSQESVAQIIGMNQKSYSRIENGSTSLKITCLEKIAKTLNIEPGRLLDSGEVVTKMEKQVTKNVYGVQNGTIQKYCPPDNLDMEKRLRKIEQELERIKKQILD